MCVYFIYTNNKKYMLLSSTIIYIHMTCSSTAWNKVEPNVKGAMVKPNYWVGCFLQNEAVEVCITDTNSFSHLSRKTYNKKA